MNGPSVPVSAKASLKGKLDQSSCGELVHMIVLTFMIYWSAALSVEFSSCSDSFQLWTRTLLRYSGRSPPICLLVCLVISCFLRWSYIVEICAHLLLRSLASCPPHFHFRISARPAMSSLTASTLIPVLGILSLDFSFHFSLADLDVFLLHSGQIPGLASIC